MLPPTTASARRDTAEPDPRDWEGKRLLASAEGIVVLSVRASQAIDPGRDAARRDSHDPAAWSAETPTCLAR